MILTLIWQFQDKFKRSIQRDKRTTTPLLPATESIFFRFVDIFYVKNISNIYLNLPFPYALDCITDIRRTMASNKLSQKDRDNDVKMTDLLHKTTSAITQKMKYFLDHMEVIIATYYVKFLLLVEFA